jgi:hypothetical protein
MTNVPDQSEHRPDSVLRIDTPEGARFATALIAVLRGLPGQRRLAASDDAEAAEREAER